MSGECDLCGDFGHGERLCPTLKKEAMTPERAVSILESLVEQGEKLIIGITKEPWDATPAGKSTEGEQLDCCIVGPMGQVLCNVFDVDDYDIGELNKNESETAWANTIFIASSHRLIPALVEGAKVVLEEISMTKIQIEEADYTGVSGDIWTRAHNRMVIGIAKVYAPRMKEAGMDVPE